MPSSHRAAWPVPLLGFSLLAACTTVHSGTHVVAHRGASARVPENTLVAIEQAIALGADVVEVDVRLSKDGRAVLFHDEELGRTTDVSGRLADLKLVELRELDAGSWMDARYSAERIPTLEEAAAVSKGRVKLMLDLKVTGGAAEVMASLRRAGFPEEDVLLGVWETKQLRELLPHRGEAALTFVGDAPEESAGLWVGFFHWLGFRAFSFSWESVTPGILHAAAQRRMPVYVWTINDEATMRTAAEAGVAGIITDEPRLLQRVLDELAAERRASYRR